MGNLIIFDALIAWRDWVQKKDIRRGSKILYLSHIAKLIEHEIVDIEQPLPEFIKNGINTKTQMINQKSDWSSATRRVRRTQLSSFYKFAQQKKIKPANIVIPFKELRDLRKVIITEILSINEDKAKSQSLTVDDILLFFTEINKINSRDALAAWMMWECKVTIHDILSLLIKDIDLTNGNIRFKDGFRLGAIRDNLRQCIQMLVKGREGLVFLTDQGKKVHPVQMVRNMKIASKRARLPIIISPKILYAHAKAYSEKIFQDMSEEERETLSKSYILKLKAACEKSKIVFTG